MAFDINSYFTTRGKNVQRGDVAAIKEAAEGLLAAPAGLTNNSSYLDWAKEALMYVKDVESGSLYDERGGKQVSKLDLAYDWLVGNMQSSRASRVFGTYGEGSKEWLAKIQNEEANIANQTDYSRLSAEQAAKEKSIFDSSGRLTEFQKSVDEYNKTYGSIFGNYSSNLKASANGYIEQVGANGQPVSAAIDGGNAPAARTPAQQAAIDRQLAVEKEAGIYPGMPESAPAPTAPATTVTTSIPGLNTVGLLEADARRRKGTANETDLKNLAYAESKGWSATGTPTAPLPAASGSTPGLNTAGLAEAYARQLAGTANATDLKNLEYAKSKGWSPSMIVTSQVSSADEANRIINAEQDADMGSRSGSDGPGTRKTLEDYMAEIKDAITPDADAPVAPDYENALQDYRAKYGLTEMEEQLDGLRAEEQDILARRDARIIAERGKTVATNVIEGRISETERQENERLSIVQRAIGNLSNQITTKYDIVNSLMGAKEMDYNVAVAAYDRAMQENITLFNAAQGMEEQFKSDEQRAIDNARSSAQIMVNSLAGSGLSYDQLSPSQQALLTKLGTESGLGSDFYRTVLSNAIDTGKEILTQITSDDKSQVSIVYKDGTSAVVPTGFSRGVNTPVGGSGGGGSTKKTDEQKEIEAFRKDAASAIERLDTDPNYTWGAAWDSLKVLYPNASPELLDATLGGGYDPNSQSYYGRAER